MATERSVLIKRKADDAPLEVLYVDTEELHHESPRKRRQIFRRVPQNEADPSTATAPRSRQSYRDSSNVSRKFSRSPLKKPITIPLQDKNAPNASAIRATPSSESQPALARRRFHMLKERIDSNAIGLSPTRGTKRKPGTAQLVVFEEDRTKKQRSSQLPSRHLADDSELATPPVTEEKSNSLIKDPDQRPRKRPNASAAERLWRQASWSNLPSRSRSRDVSPMPNAADRAQSEHHLASSQVTSLKLALELQAFSLQEAEHDRQRAAQLELAAAARNRTNEDKGAEVATSDDEMYIYDRYVRCKTPPYEGAPPEDVRSHDSFSTEAAGFLVIGKDEVEEWTAYLDDLDDEDEEEGELLEDDEDSNAEDYYTNDYPEEEEGSGEGDALEMGSHSSSLGSNSSFYGSEDERGWAGDG